LGIFIEKTKDYGIKSNTVCWYVRYAELYIKAHSKTKLMHHEPHLVEKYLESKGRNMRIEERQFIQLIMENSLIFTKMVHVS